MRKSESNLSRDSSNQRDSARLDGCESQEASLFEEMELDKPDRVGLESVLPFIEERIAFKMPSDLKYLDGVLDYLNERLLELGIVNPEDSEVIIALDEAIVNAIKHGNKCNPRKAVHIVAELSADGARFTITDEGPGFVKEKVPDPTQPSRLLKPSGRGLLLINHIMDEVCYNQCGNEIQMFKRSIQTTCRQPSSESEKTIGRKR